MSDETTVVQTACDTASEVTLPVPEAEPVKAVTPAKRRLTIMVEVEVPRSSYSWESEAKAEFSTEGQMDANMLATLIGIFTRELAQQVYKEVA